MDRAEELFATILAGGEAAIQSLIDNFESENLWLDFKQARDSGAGMKLHVDDRQNLAKAISGFGNSDGGVIVWGVDCRRDPKTGGDLPGPLVPLARPHVFRSWLENSVASCTAPPHRGVRHEAVQQMEAAGGYVVTLIPSSDTAPHQAVQPTNDLRYYMRAGSSFVTVPHSILSGMFGRRPQPAVHQFWFKPSIKMSSNKYLSLSGTIAVRNIGRSIARDIFVTVELLHPGPGTGQFMFGTYAKDLFAKHQAGSVAHFVSHDHVRLPPGATFLVTDVDVLLLGGFNRVYSGRITSGCEGAEPRAWDVALSPAEMSEIHDAAAEMAARDESLLPIFGRILRETGA